MERAKFESSSRAEVVVLGGTIVTMVLSCVCVVVLCAAANAVSGTAAKVIYAAPAASAVANLVAPSDVAALQ